MSPPQEKDRYLEQTAALRTRKVSLIDPVSILIKLFQLRRVQARLKNKKLKKNLTIAQIVSDNYIFVIVLDPIYRNIISGFGNRLLLRAHKLQNMHDIEECPARA